MNFGQIWIRLVLIGGILLSLASHATVPMPCEELILKEKIELKDAIDLEFYKATGSSLGSLTFYKKLKKNILKRYILKECMPMGCTQEMVAKLVRESIEKALIGRDLRNYGIWVAGILTSSFVTTEIILHFNPKLSFVPTFASLLIAQASLFTNSLLSPFSKPIVAKIEKFAGKAQSNVNKTFDLADQADNTTGTFSWHEQNATDRIITFRNMVFLNFRAASEKLKEHETESVVFLIADVAMNGYRHFRDIPPEDPTIVSAVQAAFILDGVIGLPDLQKRVLEHLSASDKDPKHQAYYQQALNAWLGF